MFDLVFIPVYNPRMDKERKELIELTLASPEIAAAIHAALVEVPGLDVDAVVRRFEALQKGAADLPDTLRRKVVEAFLLNAPSLEHRAEQATIWLLAIAAEMPARGAGESDARELHSGS